MKQFIKFSLLKIRFKIYAWDTFYCILEFLIWFLKKVYELYLVIGFQFKINYYSIFFI